MKKPYVIGIYGKSNIGKTTLILKMIKRLIKDGLKVATVKITDKNIGVDTKGKDTWKHSKAGADLVVLSSRIETDFMFKKHEELNLVIDQINAFEIYDIVIVEGASDKSIPKIRIGDIQKRENTILTYDNDFENLIKIIKNEISKGGKTWKK